MIIAQAPEWIVITHTTRWLNDEGKEVNLEHNEWRGAETIEEAIELAIEFMESRGIMEEIEYPLAEEEAITT